MPPSWVSRRTFLQTSGAVVAAHPWASWGSGHSTKLRIRKDQKKLTDAEWQQLRDVVVAMKKDVKELGSWWQRLANIHGTSCPHANWFFLPWHRAYLLAFENIARELFDKEFALPYWNWSEDRNIPAPFLDEKSSLYHAKRDTDSIKEALDIDAVGPVAIGRVLGELDFTQFGGGLATDLRNKREPGAGKVEREGHNRVHDWIGGDMDAKKTAPLDPLFWLMHAYVDLLWERWIRATHPKKSWPKEYSFHKQSLTFPDHENKNKTWSVADTLVLAGMHYTYDELGEKIPAPLPRAKLEQGKPEAVEAVTSKFTISAKIDVTSTSFTLKDEWLQKFEMHAADVMKPVKDWQPGKPLSQARLVFTLAKPPRQRGVSLRVFWNNPEASPKTDLRDPSYLGAIHFFGHGDDDHGHGEAGLTYSFSLSRVLTAKKRPIEAKPSVQLVYIFRKERGDEELQVVDLRLEYNQPNE